MINIILLSPCYREITMLDNNYICNNSLGFNWWTGKNHKKTIKKIREIHKLKKNEEKKIQN